MPWAESWPMFERMCIVGVGLIGGSVARAARSRGLCQTIVGVGRSQASLQRALDLCVIDVAEQDVVKGVQGADLVVICTPVGAFETLFRQLKPVWSQDALYTDVGSTKSSVTAAVEAVFGAVPENFVPAHPIAGSESNGVEASMVDLFVGRRVILTPDAGTAPNALQRCEQFWSQLGAEVSSMSVDHHDAVLAATSHLPHVLAFALVELVRSKDDEREIFKYAAGGFRDFTRIASSDPTMWADICMANADKISGLLEEYKHSIDQLGVCITERNHDKLMAFFEDANAARQQYLDVLK